MTDEIPIINPWPAECLCTYHLERAVADAYYTAYRTRPDPECPVHPPEA